MEDIRWKQRYEHYSKMLQILTDNLGEKSAEEFSELEQIGLGKSFELCFELLWKMLKDYLEFEEIEIGLISPKNILKVAAEKGLLEQIGVNGDILMQAHKSRNELVHIYDFEKFSNALNAIQTIYLPELLKVAHYLGELYE